MVHSPLQLLDFQASSAIAAAPFVIEQPLSGTEEIIFFLKGACSPLLAHVAGRWSGVDLMGRRIIRNYSHFESLSQPSTNLHKHEKGILLLYMKCQNKIHLFLGNKCEVCVYVLYNTYFIRIFIYSIF